MFEQNYMKMHLSEGKFALRPIPPRQEIDTPFEEAKKAAIAFYKKYKNKKIILCLSGGLDSEIMAEAFLAAKIPFTASIWKYENNFNNYDIKHAIEFCKIYNIKYEMMYLDLNYFYKCNLHLHYAKKYLCNSPQVAVHFYLLEKLIEKDSNIAVCLPWQPPFIGKSYDNKIFVKIIPCRYISYYRFFYLNQLDGTAYFLMYSSSLLYSFLKLPISKKILNLQIEPSMFKSYQIKAIMYEQGGFLSKRKQGKFTGFDKFKVFMNKKYSKKYDQFFRHPLEQLIPDSKDQVFFISSVWKEDSKNQEDLAFKQR